MELKKPGKKKTKKKGAGCKPATLDGKWREAVNKRFNYQCAYVSIDGRRCGETEGLQAHHIVHRSDVLLKWELKNGILCCLTHHIFFDKLQGLESIKKIIGIDYDYIKWLQQITYPGYMGIYEDYNIPDLFRKYKKEKLVDYIKNGEPEYTY